MKQLIASKWDELISIRTKEDILSFLESNQKLFRNLFTSVEIGSIWINVAMSLPRIIFGFLLLTEVYKYKIGMPAYDVQGMLPQDLVLPAWLDWIGPDTLIWAERIEYGIYGSLLITGFTTRMISFTLLWIVLWDLFTTQADVLFSPVLVSLFMITCLYSLVLGSGKFGVDHLIFRRKTTD
ncbi:hypothetical protein AB2B38_009065 [Balneola sp. MJW-20]|uniref:hypothetical protein n=1 Tax=Gracilimonas aurantiaca TaxID=3234185 RepID=UPI0034652004